MSSDNQAANIKFTTREIECLQQFLQGKFPIDIAENLGVSENTVKFYVLNGAKKMIALVSLRQEV